MTEWILVLAVKCNCHANEPKLVHLLNPYLIQAEQLRDLRLRVSRKIRNLTTQTPLCSLLPNSRQLHCSLTSRMNHLQKELIQAEISELKHVGKL